MKVEIESPHATTIASRRSPAAPLRARGKSLRGRACRARMRRKIEEEEDEEDEDEDEDESDELGERATCMGW